MQKYCNSCCKYKDKEEFNYRKRTYKGETRLVLNSMCRECNTNKSKEYYHNTKNTKIDKVTSIFIRNRGNRYIVYIQCKQGNKIKQVNKGSFLDKDEALSLKIRLLNKYKINK